ncbi:hypothetical protein DJ568_04390 [Mucilaginibacter hurinus]|uniref:Sulfatase N-terminal domain-containing protein n=1 Tax=Mucilaginibacter hurinus TaxID=2201324 RepID=A0A367GTG5_9SPHI|nr:alkaline phosphatase family protein [Mucilaginibacter hurinus]RCH55993.1 hypothetical protein DJ568_04390 [Mucilaginibacter hurinus]
MLRSLISFARFIIFWLVFAIITRATFELYFIDKLKKADFAEIIQTFIYGLRIDLSAAGYIAALPLLTFIITWFIPRAYVKPVILRIYVYLFVFIISLVTILNLNIFREWGTKISFRVFDTLYHSPSEAVASTGSSPIGLSIFIGIVLLTLGIVLSSYIIDFNFKKPVVPLYLKIPVALLLAGLNLLIIRGGLQVAPMNQSMAYFSDKQILNQCALNTEWNLIHNTIEYFKTPYNPYIFMPANNAATIVDSLYRVNKDTTERIFTTNRPNVVFIQLEGATADVFESLGGEKGVSPNFESFVKEGVLFNNILSSSDRTDKGIIAILSAFPSQATRTVIVDNYKQARMPSLITTFKDNGYGTSYFYGGESEFMNFKAYILSHKTDDLFDKTVFRPEDMNSKWGAHDDIVLTRQLEYLNEQKQPFFSYMQTLTNHEPFELPVKPRFPGEDLGDKFRSTSHYVDASLKTYFDEAKKQSWYKNTLFILVADHGHRLPKNTSDPFEPEKYHIPLLFLGEVIKPEYRGKRINKLGSQTDIAATLLAQLDMPHKQFKWSKNLLNPYSKEFAFFDWDNGFGLSFPQQTISYDNSGGRVIYIRNRNIPQAVNDSILLQGKAYMQQVFTDYMNF